MARKKWWRRRELKPVGVFARWCVKGEETRVKTGCSCGLGGGVRWWGKGREAQVCEGSLSSIVSKVPGRGPGGRGGSQFRRGAGRRWIRGGVTQIKNRFMGNPGFADLGLAGRSFDGWWRGGGVLGSTGGETLIKMRPNAMHWIKRSKKDVRIGPLEVRCSRCAARPIAQTP